MTESTIVSAVGVSSGSLSSDPARKALAQLIERAMSDAVLACAEEGITDDDVIRNRMQEARARVKGE